MGLGNLSLSGFPQAGKVLVYEGLLFYYFL